MVRILPALAALTLAASAAGQEPEAPAAGEPTPLWRADLTRLADDVATLQSCFVSADQHNDALEEPCIGMVIGQCRHELGEEAAVTTAGARGCNWRELAAWEEVLDDALEALRAELEGGPLVDLETAQTAWEAYMVADVRAQAAPYDGGSLQGVIASDVRARLVAARAVGLRAFRRSLKA
jgi:uncharacterized protein YecT (DUF1311 family)